MPRRTKLGCGCSDYLTLLRSSLLRDIACLRFFASRVRCPDECAFHDLNMPLTTQRLIEHKQVDYSCSLVFNIISCRFARLSGQRVSVFRQQLFGNCIHAHQWPQWIVRTSANCEYIFHTTHKSGVGFGCYAPSIFQPGIKFIFFSVLRVVSCEIVSTKSNSTKRSRISRNDHCLCPSGS